MALPAPNAFSNDLAQWVANKCMGSVVFVELRPKNPEKLKELWDEVIPIVGDPDAESDDDEGEQEHKARLAECGHYQCCTGSVVSNNNGSLKILTCAHVLGPAFNKEHQIRAPDVNGLFEGFILCDHNEQKYQKDSVLDARVRRTFMTARVVRISCSRDLMLLRVSEQVVQNCCQHPHPVLRIARSFPKRLVRVVMLSWPIKSERTAVEGNITHHSRPFNHMSDSNPCDFEMRLSQVDITSEAGSSGAPLLNGVGNFCGVLYGGNVKFSFYVSFQDLKEQSDLMILLAMP